MVRLPPLSATVAPCALLANTLAPAMPASICTVSVPEVAGWVTVMPPGGSVSSDGNEPPPRTVTVAGAEISRWLLTATRYTIPTTFYNLVFILYRFTQFAAPLW
jgi:hypothetical protein